MSNFLSRRWCLQAGTLFIASVWLANTSYSQQSGGGIFSLGISDDGGAGFTWRANPEPNLAGYKLYVGTLPGVYSGFVDVGRVTSYQFTDLFRGMTYYFALTAYNTAGMESDFTPELSRQIPLIPAGGGVTAITNGAPALQSPTDDLTQIIVTNGVPDPEPLFDTPPIISEVPDLVVSKNRFSDAILFTVSDPDTPAGDLQVEVYSSNPLVLPSSGLILVASDTERGLLIDPANGQAGISIVTLAVTDGSSVTTVSFQVEVENGESASQIVPPLQ